MLQNAFCPLTENIMSEVAIGIDQISARARTLKCFPTHVPLANAQKRAHKHTHTHTHTQRKKEREREIEIENHLKPKASGTSCQ